LFWQITNTTPLRRMTLHFSHIGFTDGLTFMIPFRRFVRRSGSGRRPGRRYRIEDFASAQAKRLARGQDSRW
jgi:hypothetical protein